MILLVKLTWNPLQHQVEIKRNKEEKNSLKSNSNHKGIWVNFINKNNLQRLFEVKKNQGSLQEVTINNFCLCN